jgi:hypothetical protein
LCARLCGSLADEATTVGEALMAAAAAAAAAAMEVPWIMAAATEARSGDGGDVRTEIDAFSAQALRAALQQLLLHHLCAHREKRRAE